MSSKYLAKYVTTRSESQGAYIVVYARDPAYTAGMPKNNHFVLARDFTQFRNWCLDNDERTTDPKFVLVCNIEQLHRMSRGRHWIEGDRCTVLDPGNEAYDLFYAALAPTGIRIDTERS